jgi:hypothetical protein
MDCTTCANCCRHSVVPVQKAKSQTSPRILARQWKRLPGPTPLPIPRCPPHESCGRRPRGACSWKGVCARFMKPAPRRAGTSPMLRSGSTRSAGARPRWPGGFPCAQSFITLSKRSSTSLATIRIGRSR